MIQNQQIIAPDDEVGGEMEAIPAHDQAQQLPNAQERQVREELGIFQAIEKYLEEHCCLKFLLFLTIILLIVGINQQKSYLVKKQHTFKFFIEKIQKEKIKKELLSENQDKAGQNIGPEPSQKDPESLSSHPMQSNQSSPEGTDSQHSSEKASLASKRAAEQDKRYQSIEGITMSKIVQALRWRGLKDEDIWKQSEAAREELSYYEQKYRISQYEEIPFCLVVPTFNNAANSRHLSNIKSIVMQNYTNYRIVVVDDASTDSTATDIQEYLQGQAKVNKSNYILILNKHNQGSSKNIRKVAFEQCRPEDIMMIVDGDDQLIGRQVLKLYNAVYQETGAWVVYSNFFTESGKIGYSKPIPLRVIQPNLYRKYPFVSSHLRSFYTQLLRNIKEEDLMEKNGSYFKAANDVSVMLPSLQMAHNRVIYIPQIPYLYNDNTGLNNHSLKLLQQKRNERLIRKKSPYHQLEFLKDGNTTLLINQRDELLTDSLKLEWFRQALQIQNSTKDLGDFADRLSHNT